MQTEIAGLTLSYKNAQELNLKAAEAKERADKDLLEAKKNYLTLKKRVAILIKFLGGTL